MSDEDRRTEGGADDGQSDDEVVDQWVEDAASEADDGEDPFEQIGEGSGPRHGDPFDTFENASTQSEESATEGGSRPDPARNGLPSGLEDDSSPSAAEGTTPDAGDPFTEFDEPGSDPFGEGESVFERVDVGDVDDGVWERMESSDPDATAVQGKHYVDVNKHSYCESCEYFSEPPDIACSHEGTEILEFVDVDTVRVADCPVVAERKAIEDDE